MPGQAMHQKAHCPALANANAHLNFSPFICFSLLSICVEGNWGCIAVCNGLLLFLQIAIGGMPGHVTHQNVCRPARHPAHHNLEYVLLFCFSFLSIFLEGNGGLTVVCCVLRGMLGTAMH